VIINEQTQKALTIDSNFHTSLKDLIYSQNKLFKFIHVSKGWYRIESKITDMKALDFKQRNISGLGYLITLENKDLSESQLWKITPSK